MTSCLGEWDLPENILNGEKRIIREENEGISLKENRKDGAFE